MPVALGMGQMLAGKAVVEILDLKCLVKVLLGLNVG